MPQASREPLVDQLAASSQDMNTERICVSDNSGRCVDEADVMSSRIAELGEM